MRNAAQTFQILEIGGLTDRNWLRMEIKSEDWKREAPEKEKRVCEIVVGSLPVDLSPSSAMVGRPGEGGILCAAHTDSGEMENAPMKSRAGMHLAHDVYGSKMAYAKTTHDVEIPTSSLSGGTSNGIRVDEDNG